MEPKKVDYHHDDANAIATTVRYYYAYGKKMRAKKDAETRSTAGEMTYILCVEQPAPISLPTSNCCNVYERCSLQTLGMFLAEHLQSNAYTYTFIGVGANYMGGSPPRLL